STYLAKLVDISAKEALSSRPRHPHTNPLLSAIPAIDENGGGGQPRILLGGDVPSPIEPPQGCRFHPRCPKARPLCSDEEPILERKAGDLPDHGTACHYPVAAGGGLGRRPRDLGCLSSAPSSSFSVHRLPSPRQRRSRAGAPGSSPGRGSAATASRSPAPS